MRASDKYSKDDIEQILDWERGDADARAV